MSRWRDLFKQLANKLFNKKEQSGSSKDYHKKSTKKSSGGDRYKRWSKDFSLKIRGARLEAYYSKHNTTPTEKAVKIIKNYKKLK